MRAFGEAALTAVFLGATVTCFASLFLGQATLRLLGASGWNWLAPAVGLSLLMLAATPAVHVPGRMATVGVVLAALSLAAAIWCLRSPPHRPPLVPLLAAIPVALLAALPFLAAGRGGILGVTLDNDMAVHLVFVEGYVSAAVAAVSPLPRDYPLGPHAVAAALSKGLGIEADYAFSAFTMALPILAAWTVQAVARRATWFGRLVVAIVAGMPFLVAAYYGEGSFKEVAQAALVVAVALYLCGCGPGGLGRRRWVPLALLVGGIISCFSLPGLVWPAAFLVIWAAGLLVIQARRGRLREVPAIVRRELPALVIGVGALVLVLLPQAHRMWEFFALREGTGIAVTDIGNLVGPLSGWEALGVWGNADFRLPTSTAFTGGIWSVMVLAAIAFGSFWALRRGRWLLPIAAAAAFGIWIVSEQSQSPYVSAKALVVASPLLLLVAALPLVDEPPPRRRLRLWLPAVLLGTVLLFGVLRTDLRTLRWSPVGSTDHARQLQSFRSRIAGQPTLFLGNDEFIAWEARREPGAGRRRGLGARGPPASAQGLAGGAGDRLRHRAGFGPQRIPLGYRASRCRRQRAAAADEAGRWHRRLRSLEAGRAGP